MNLATNAVHAMDRKGTLTVRLYSERLEKGTPGQIGELVPGEYTVIGIADTGCGMDPVTLSRAFEPFFTTKTEEEGTGLGLSVVRGVVQSAGGDIKIESVVGAGTSVRIYLPASEEQASATPRVNVQGSLSGTEHVLFVDDEEMFIEMNVEWLTALGYRVTAMTDSREALTYVNGDVNTIDLLITDQTMPGLSGLELATEALKSRPALPVILCSGFSSEISSEAVAASGIERFLMKPYRYHEIGTAVREVLDGTTPATG